MGHNTKKTIVLAALCGLGLLGGGTVSAQAQTPTVPMMARHAERHPDLRIALRALNRARVALMHGAHDFSGHREQALDLTNQAIAQVQQAIQDDAH